MTWRVPRSWSPVPYGSKGGDFRSKRFLELRFQRGLGPQGLLPMRIRMGVRVRRWWLVVLFVALATGGHVYAEDDETGSDEAAPTAASPAVSIAPVRGSTQIPHPPGRKWKLGERACLDGRCGTVRMVTRDYAVVEAERTKPKPPPKRPKRRAEDDRDDDPPEPPPKPLEPEPPSSFSGVPADATDGPVLLPEPLPPVVPSTPATTGPKRKRPSVRLDANRTRRREPLHPWWAHVQLNVAGAFRENGAKLFSPQISWNPTFGFEGAFRVRGHLGVTLLKTDANAYFGVVEPGVFASFGGGVFRVEPGVGMQVWLGQGGVYPLLQMNFVVSFEQFEESPRFFERFFVGPAVVFSTATPTYFVKAGFGFAF